MKTIIDISKFQTVTDWSKVKSAVDGVIIRLGFRGYGSGTISYDSKYNEFKTNLEKYNIPYSFYFFPCSINDNEALEEAKFIINEYKKAKTSLPVYLDSEIADVKNKAGRSDRLSRDTRTRLLKIILDELNKNNIPCGTYASTSWLNNQLDMSKLNMYSVWVAQYNTVCTYKGAYDMWQYTSKASVPGITGNVDMSRLYNESILKVNGSTTKPVTPTKSIGQVAQDVFDNKYGTGAARKAKLEAEGYNYAEVQKRVTEIDKTHKEIASIEAQIKDLESKKNALKVKETQLLK